MKGPYERLKYDLRRVWECPHCGHRERTPGDVTFQICRCQTNEEWGKQVYMRLVDDGGRRKPSVVTASPIGMNSTAEDQSAVSAAATANPDGAPAAQAES